MPEEKPKLSEIHQRPIDKGINRSIYFASTKMIEQLEKLVERYPRASVSSIIQQMVAAIIAKHNDMKDEEIARRYLDVEMRIYF